MRYMIQMATSKSIQLSKIRELENETAYFYAEMYRAAQIKKNFLRCVSRAHTAGLSIREIAAVLNINKDTVHRMIKAADNSVEWFFIPMAQTRGMPNDISDIDSDLR